MKSFCIAVRAVMIVLCSLSCIVAKAGTTPDVQCQFTKQALPLTLVREKISEKKLSRSPFLSSKKRTSLFFSLPSLHNEETEVE